MLLSSGILKTESANASQNFGQNPTTINPESHPDNRERARISPKNIPINPVIIPT